MKDIIILYHAHCYDGFSGAWAAYKKFGSRADYLGIAHQEPPPPNLENKELYFIDFVYPEEIFKKIVSSNKKVVALDHHATSAAAIKLAHEYVYDNNHSGAVIAWNFFHPQKSTPVLLKYIEDNDIWNFRMPHAQAVGRALSTQPFTFNNWNKLAKDFEDPVVLKKYIAKGQLITEYRNSLLNELVELNSYFIKFENKKILTCNAPHFFASELGHLLAAKQPPFSIIWSNLGDKIHVSLRGAGKIDVGKISKKYGGGGHFNAAGFSWPASKPLPWKVMN